MSNETLSAVILAGGKGTRLHPFSAMLPKSLMPLGHIPVLELLLRQLKRSGIDKAILAVGHLHHLIQAYFGDGRNVGLDISYSVESRPLGTAGPLEPLLDRIGDHFILANGDLLTTLNFQALLATHRRMGASATVGVYRHVAMLDYGVVEMDTRGMLIGYKEKPKIESLVSMGIYVLDANVIRRQLCPGTYCDMPELLTRLIVAGENVIGYESDCDWYDIGNPNDFARAQQAYEAHPTAFLPPATIVPTL
jgi:NDP-mannose synthase